MRYDINGFGPFGLEKKKKKKNGFFYVLKIGKSINWQKKKNVEMNLKSQCNLLQVYNHVFGGWS